VTVGRVPSAAVEDLHVVRVGGGHGDGVHIVSGPSLLETVCGLVLQRGQRDVGTASVGALWVDVPLKVQAPLGTLLQVERYWRLQRWLRPAVVVAGFDWVSLDN
jgi:hypothetical protein